jgi:hypothetical protein
MLTCAVLYLMMNPQRQGSRADSAGDTAISRRSVLAAGGIVVFGGLSGCLDRVASAVTNTGAAPAAVFAGETGGGGGGRVKLLEPRVTRLTPALSSPAGDVELEGWVTATTLMAQDYNSSRSNKRKTQSGGEDSDGDGVDDGDADSDGDGVGDGTEGSRANYNNTRSNRSTARPPDIVDDELDEDDETFRVVSRLDTELQEATTTAWSSISKRSARTGRNPELDKEVSGTLDEMAAALAELRAVLERCSDEVCVAALANVADREADLTRAKDHIENEEWDPFGLGGGDEADILVGDYFLPPATFDPSDSYSAGEQAALYRYLNGDAVVAERCTVCLPDAEVPGGNGSIRDSVTPEGVLNYLMGDGSVSGLSKADSKKSRTVGGGDCDDDDPGNHPGAVCGSSPHFVSEVTGPVTGRGGLNAVRADDGTLVVMGLGPAAEGGSSVLVCPAEGDAYEPANLRSWGERSADVPPVLTQQGRLNGLTVAQVQVQPPGCPQPIPALFYVGRGESDEQLIYSGGWVIDDSKLYETASTVLTTVDSALVVGIELSDLESMFEDVAGGSAGIPATLELAARRTRGRVRYNARGARLDTGPADELVEEGVITAAAKKGYDAYKAQTDTSARTQEADRKGGTWVVTHLALDAPILHLTNAGSASNEVKFKAGAELSGQVN